MMDSFVKDLKKQVQCSLCTETMSEPKLLTCFHTFCKLCIIKRNTQVNGQDNIFKCPKCSSQTVLKERSDGEDLQTSPIHCRMLQVLSLLENRQKCSIEASHEAIWRCLDCHFFLCCECLGNHAKFAKDHKVVRLSNLSKEDIDVMLKREDPCKVHTSQDVEWYCKDCNKLICLLCLKDHNHDKHELSSLQEFMVEKKHYLKKNVEKIKGLATHEENRKNQEEIANDIRHYGKQAIEQVKKTSKQLIKSLVDHEQQLVTDIQATTAKAERNLCILCHTAEAQEYVDYFAENATASEMIDICATDSSNNFSTYEPFEQDVGGIHFVPNQDLYNQVSDSGLGFVKSSKKADAKQSAIKVNGKIEAMTKINLVLVLKTSQGKPADESLDKITVQVTPEDDVQIGEKRRVNDDEVTLELTARFPGQVTAHVEVRGNPVSNSPLVLEVKPQQILTKTTKLTTDLNVGSKCYTGIAVNKTNDRLAVADDNQHCVRVFNMDGGLLLKFGNEGSGQGQYHCPKGLAWLGETDLVITDYFNVRICILDTVNKRTVKMFGCQGNGNGQFSFPHGVFVDDDSNIIVCDRGNSRIQGFTKDGEYLYQFTLTNAMPCDALLHKGLLYVSDCKSSVIHVIETNDKRPSKIICSIGGNVCAAPGQLEDPWGMAIDNDDNLLVCCNKEIYKFTLDGRFIGKTNELSNHCYYITVLNTGEAIGTLWGEGFFAI